MFGPWPWRNRNFLMGVGTGFFLAASVAAIVWGFEIHPVIGVFAMWLLGTAAYAMGWPRETKTYITITGTTNYDGAYEYDESDSDSDQVLM